MARTGYMRVVLSGHEAMNCRAMRMADDAAYRAYVSGLVWLDWRLLLKASHGDYPVATTARQVDILIEVLQMYRAEMR